MNYVLVILFCLGGAVFSTFFLIALCRECGFLPKNRCCERLSPHLPRGTVLARATSAGEDLVAKVAPANAVNGFVRNEYKAPFTKSLFRP